MCLQTMQNKQMIVVLYCTLIDYVVLLSMYDTYNTIERMSIIEHAWEKTLICGFLIFLLRVNQYHRQGMDRSSIAEVCNILLEHPIVNQRYLGTIQASVIASFWNKVMIGPPRLAMKTPPLGIPRQQNPLILDYVGMLFYIPRVVNQPQVSRITCHPS